MRRSSDRVTGNLYIHPPIDHGTGVKVSFVDEWYCGSRNHPVTIEDLRHLSVREWETDTPPVDIFSEELQDLLIDDARRYPDIYERSPCEWPWCTRPKRSGRTNMKWCELHRNRYTHKKLPEQGS